MIKVCTICARGGSKGILNKNIKLINGKPLISYSIKQAKDSKQFDLIAVSSDSSEILNTAKKYGADLLIERPNELATDSSAKLPVIQHAMLAAEKHLNKKIDILVDLDCTSPLRKVDDIIGAIKLLESNLNSNVITGAPARRSPYFNLVEEKSDGSVSLAKKMDKPIVRRQDVPRCFDMNASIYAWRRDDLLGSATVIKEGTLLYEMPEERSTDIDSELDFKIVELLMKGRADLC
jgi:N-acylneuraminate cytidylyltransferase/CMP-N,N'-diacetyllegionaminic acid synthase